MTFKKNHQFGFISSRERKLGKQPITFRGYEGQLESLRLVAGWQEALREYADKLIAEANIESE